MKTYTVLKPVIHDGTEYVPGETIELADENAAYLQRRGAISRVAEPETPTKTKKTEETRRKP